MYWSIGLRYQKRISALPRHNAPDYFHLNMLLAWRIDLSCMVPSSHVQLANPPAAKVRGADTLGPDPARGPARIFVFRSGLFHATIQLI